MARLTTILVCGVGWLIVLLGAVAPLVGMAVSAFDRDRIATATIGIPGGWTLLLHSAALSVIAAAGAVGLGLVPGAVLGSRRGRTLPVVLGLTLVPLLIPPQVYAYAWQLMLAPKGLLGGLMGEDTPSNWDRTLQAGAVSAGWLWPVAALILAAGWRHAARGVYALAQLDAAPWRAYSRGALPSLRPFVAASATVVAAITMIEYAIPHLLLARVYATEVLTLVNVSAPPGQVMRLAAGAIATIAVIGALGMWSLRSMRHWMPLDAGDEIDAGIGSRRSRDRVPGGRMAGVIFGGIWLGSVALPVVVLVASLRSGWAWRQGFMLLDREWSSSLVVASTTGVLAMVLAAATVMLGLAGGRKWPYAGGLAALVVALMPPSALGVGFITIFNRGEFVSRLYTDTPWVWILSLLARYGAIAVVISWLTLRRRAVATAEQARSDGADGPAVLAHVLVPMAAPTLLASGLIVAVLSMFEVIITQLVGPVDWPSIAMTILGHMHYGRDDVVITTSLAIVVGGLVVTQLCAWLLVRWQR